MLAEERRASLVAESMLCMSAERRSSSFSCRP